MRSIAFIWVVALITAALAQGASAQEKIRLAQSWTVTNCVMLVELCVAIAVAIMLFAASRCSNRAQRSFP